mmetsp:Transcript_17857/g.32287  ORF Transcript_17857/g.32287 Transcript_17857/m.32287 type:complete len:140 (+) Transcript_17857:246-665(+)
MKAKGGDKRLNARLRSARGHNSRQYSPCNALIGFLCYLGVQHPWPYTPPTCVMGWSTVLSAYPSSVKPAITPIQTWCQRLDFERDSVCQDVMVSALRVFCILTWEYSVVRSWAANKKQTTLLQVVPPEEENGQCGEDGQ